MRVLLHLGRAALVFWVGAILLPTAVVDATTTAATTATATAPHQTPRTALQGVSGTAETGRDRVGRLTAEVHGTEGDIRDIVARVRLEAERFIDGLP